MIILRFAPNFQKKKKKKKMHFCTTENFGVKSWFLKTLQLRPKDRKYKQFILKNILAYIFFDIIEYV